MNQNVSNFCPNCGEQNNSMRFCGNCGFDFSNNPTNKSISQQNYSQPKPNSAQASYQSIPTSS